MSATSEAAVIFLGLNSLAWPALIAGRRMVTPSRRRSGGATQTTGAVRVTSPAPAPAATQPGQLAAVSNGQLRSKRLPKLRPLEECKQPNLAQYARGRQRDEHGHFIPAGRAS